MVSVQPGMQANAQQVQDDLANLFSRNLTFNPDFHVSAQKETARQEPTPAAPVSQPVVYSISQHYHHSAHTAKSAAQLSENQGQCRPQRPSSEPPQSEISTTEMILRGYGVDPAVLTPSQVQLFRVADDPQKLRLIELWSICPPNRAEDIPSLAWSSTTLGQEEHLAQMRYERQHNSTMSLDGTLVQTDDGKWTQQVSAESEPYMISGDVYNHYGTAVGSNRYSRSTDPVYKGPDYDQQQQQLGMAVQYDSFEQFRNASMPVDAMDVM